ncbi:energy-coupling factor ABC transporter ATP-binding protein [Kiritimatiella glycovorans]|uniref:Cobalt import ATP-binding protein CbiO n=1 Tax=Kiritimatiella glycovorans TaxID=1307763 RepID=A0A0G3ELU4_9BACT|nr:ABC transporter ATP-binding protein [Kiritimatiella glycovorans]AKJ65134.1 Cobalt import ATP-binding protein CbiO [Kiritimatiella glycovorans]
MIEVRDLHFHYAGGPSVLSGLNLRIDQGDRLGLYGENGAGKTTLFHLIMGLEFPGQGRVICFGEPRTTEAEFQDVRPRIGLLFQDAEDQLFCPTVLEDVAFGPLNQGCRRAAAEERVQEALEKVGLPGFEDRRIHTLSGGEKKRIAIAGLLAMKPDVLLLDEPAAQLDAAGLEILRTILRDWHGALVIASHRPVVFKETVTREVFLKNGVITG